MQMQKTPNIGQSLIFTAISITSSNRQNFGQRLIFPTTSNTSGNRKYVGWMETL